MLRKHCLASLKSENSKIHLLFLRFFTSVYLIVMYHAIAVAAVYVGFVGCDPTYSLGAERTTMMRNSPPPTSIINCDKLSRYYVVFLISVFYDSQISELKRVQGIYISMKFSKLAHTFPMCFSLVQLTKDQYRITSS